MSKMKYKKIATLLAVTTLFGSSVLVGNSEFQEIIGMEVVQASSGIGVLVNGNKIEFSDADPFVEDGRTMVPLRGVFEAMGFSVNWDGDVWTGSSEDLQSLYGTTNPELIGINTATSS